MQSTEEVIRLFDEYGRGFAPSDLIFNESNAKALADYVFAKYGLVTISYLIEAEQALGAQLQRVKQPTAAEKAAADAKKAEERMQRDYLDSIKPQPNFYDRQKAEQAEQEKKKAEKAAKEQSDAKAQLAIAISGYQAYLTSGGGIDYGTTEMVQRELRTVKFGNDAIRTLAAVRQIIQELPDHPKAGDVDRVIEKINVRLRQQANEQKDSLGSGVKKAGSLGGLR